MTTIQDEDDNAPVGITELDDEITAEDEISAEEKKPAANLLPICDLGLVYWWPQSAFVKTCSAPIINRKLVAQVGYLLNDIVPSEEQACFSFAGNSLNIRRALPTFIINLFTRKYIPIHLSSLSGVVGLAVVYPLDIQHTRQVLAQVSNVVKDSVEDGTSFVQDGSAKGKKVSIYEWHGKGLVSLLTGGGDITGIGASIAGIFAYQLAQHAISPHLNDLNPYKLEKGVVGILSKFCVALAAVSVSGLVAYPFDTVRRSLMIQACKPVDEWKFQDSTSCAKYICDEQGVGGLWRGAGLNVARTLVASISVVVYGEFAHGFVKEWKKK